jgi:predicted nucleic acid-binding protein
MYTLDTNAVVYYLKDEPAVVAVLRPALTQDAPVFVSTITELELFSYSALTDDDAEKIEDILASSVVVPVDSRVARAAATLRRQRPGLKTPDSAIAATALLTHTTLLTRNARDFDSIPGLRMQEI